MVGLVFCLPGGSWKPGSHPPPPGLVEHAKLSQRVEAGGGGHHGGTGGAGPGLGGLSPRPNKGGSLPRRDRQEAPRVGPQESRALQKPQLYPAWPGAGVPESWAVGSLTKGSPSHPRAGSLGPGVGGRTLKALTRGAEAGRRKPEAWGPGRASGAGGRVCSLAGAGWLCRLDPHLPVGKGLLRAGWKRWPTQGHPPPSPPQQGPLSTEVSPENRKESWS